jgi:hypothetical protein
MPRTLITRPRHLAATALVAAAAATAVLTGNASSAQADGRTVFVPGVSVSADGDTVTFPLRTGRTTDGRSVDFVVIEASTSSAAAAFNVKVVNKLRNAGTAAVQKVTLDRGTVVFPATVDFTPDRAVDGTLGTGWPPTVATPGSRGEAGYSPLVRLPDGSVLNAPQLGNGTGLHDKVVSIDRTAKKVTLRLTDGFSRGTAVVYLSTDATAEGPAALEGSTYAPKLDAAPRAGDDSTASARAGLAAFINGPTGNPATRQGINSTLLGEGDPLNVLAWLPGQGRYSPLWDVHLTAWAPGVTPTRQTRFADVEDLAAAGKVTAPDGSPWAASNVIVDCPIIATS